MIEVDGIQQALEYDCSLHGDLAADAFLKVIDLVTTPAPSTKQKNALAHNLRRLDVNYEAFATKLHRRSMLPTYQRVMAEVLTLAGQTD